MADPKYEVWGNWVEDAEYGAEDFFLEDCDTLEEARKACAEWQTNPSRYAYVVDKETGKMI